MLKLLMSHICPTFSSTLKASLVNVYNSRPETGRSIMAEACCSVVDSTWKVFGFYLCRTPYSAPMSLQEALRRSFVALRNQQAAWRSVLEECDPLMGSLANLGQQMNALSRVRVSDTPLRVFPDLQERLQFQLLQAADLLLQRLGDSMSRLQSIRDSIGNQASAVLQLYRDSSEGLGLAAATERSASIPSLADMLEWLQDAERHYRRQFLQRKTLLQTLRLDDLSQLEAVSKRWKSLESPDSEQQITDALCRLSFFMESQ